MGDPFMKMMLWPLPYGKDKERTAVPSPTVADTATKEAAEREAELIKKKKKTGAAIMTTQQGLTESPTVLKKTLGG